MMNYTERLTLLMQDVVSRVPALSFIDVTSSRMILDAARSLPAPRRMILRCRPGPAARLVLLGAADIPGVSLVTVDDQ